MKKLKQDLMTNRSRWKRNSLETLLAIRNLRKDYNLKSGFLNNKSFSVLEGLDLEVNKGEIVGLVGESGCGKTTLSKMILSIEFPTSGEILWKGKDLIAENRYDRARKIGIVFQDPYSSFNPRKTIFNILLEPLLISGSQENHIEKIQETITLVGLDNSFLNKYPHMLSGGQRQRVAIGRALMNSPELLICDEPVSALDVSIQAQILNLLNELKAKLGISILFISHDLSVVQFISDRVAVMYLGAIVEAGKANDVFLNPQHPYTQLLLDSVLTLDSKKQNGPVSFSELPSAMSRPNGCAFQSRCGFAKEECRSIKPMKKNKNEHFYVCHLEK